MTEMQNNNREKYFGMFNELGFGNQISSSP